MNIRFIAFFFTWPVFAFGDTNNFEHADFDPSGDNYEFPEAKQGNFSLILDAGNLYFQESTPSPNGVMVLRQFLPELSGICRFDSPRALWIDSGIIRVTQKPHSDSATWYLRKDMSRGHHFLERPRLPDLGLMVMRYAAEPAYRLLRAPDSVLKAAMQEKFPRYTSWPMLTMPITSPNEDGKYHASYGDIHEWHEADMAPRYDFTFSTANRVHWVLEEVIGYVGFYKRAPEVEPKQGKVLRLQMVVDSPGHRVKLIARAPKIFSKANPDLSPPPKLAAELFMDVPELKQSGMPVLPEEILENPAVTWSANGCALILEDGPLDSRRGRLLVLRRDAASQAVFLEEPFAPWLPKDDLQHGVTLKEPKLPAADKLDLFGGDIPLHFIVKPLNFYKPEFSEEKGPWGPIDKNQGIRYEIQQAKELEGYVGDAHKQLKPLPDAHRFRLKLGTADWIRFEYDEISRVDNKTGEEVIIYTKPKPKQ